MNDENPGQQPVNALEQAYVRAARGVEGRPELFRALREWPLHFLMPFHPEMEGTVSLGGEDEIAFINWQNGGKAVVPVFTSPERVREALGRTGLGAANRFTMGTMPGELLFRLLGGQTSEVVLNPACALGAVELDLAAVRMLADGSILEPIQPGVPQESGAVVAVPPAEYPTDFIQPLFSFLRAQPLVRAAWLCQMLRGKPASDGEKPGVFYGFLLVIQGILGQKIDEAVIERLKQDFAVVAHNSPCPGVGFGVQVIHLGTMDDTTLTQLEQWQAFYTSPGFELGATTLLE